MKPGTSNRRKALVFATRALVVGVLCGIGLKCIAPQSTRVGNLRATGAITRPATMPAFTFDRVGPDADPYLPDLRQEFQLDQVIKGASDDLDRLHRLCTWVTQQWEHDGNNHPKQADPASILRAARQGQRFRCVEYATVLTGVCQAVGLPARTVGLMTEDVETRRSGAGHVVTEVYLPDRAKWVMADPQWNTIPMHGQTPLSVVEFEDLMGHAPPGELSTHRNTPGYTDRYFEWIRPYLFYVKVPVDARLKPSSHQYAILVPPGSRPPRVFQIVHPIGDAIYTSFPADLYPTPALSAHPEERQ